MDETPVPDSEVDLAYCTRYCRAQVSAGTLQGTPEECVRRCCRGATSDCVVPDATVPDEPDAQAPADGSTCENPCGGACCQADEGCSLAGSGHARCVKTCTTGGDCPTGCCAPATNAKGEPVGPYICKPNDGNPYNCCSGITVTCGADTCCVADERDNKFCAKKCLDNTQCGEARCVDYSFTWSTCQGPTACGP